MKKRILLVSLVVLALLMLWTIWGNTALELNTITVTSNRLPKAFHGFRIAHISDLHNTEIGDGNERVIAMLQECRPDIIAITGDLIDSRKTDMEIALSFAEAAMQIAPCYYVTGNHEARIDKYDELKVSLENMGVAVMENTRTPLEYKGESIVLLGVNDPSFSTDYLFGEDELVMSSALSEIKYAEDRFSVLLSHRPELFDVYANHGIDLILSGHAHGGQFRLPFGGGLVAPNQGFFPEYDAGLYSQNNTNMIVSRGIGNSLFPFRVNNRPEIVLIHLESGAQ